MRQLQHDLPVLVRAGGLWGHGVDRLLRAVDRDLREDEPKRIFKGCAV